MDFEKLYDLSSSVNTWTEFVFEHAVAIKKISCSLSGGIRTAIENDFLLRCYENEYCHFKKNMEDLILKYKELEKFLNENNIRGV